MKLSKTYQSAALAVLTTLVLAACSSTSTKPDDSASKPPANVVSSEPSISTNTPSNTVQTSKYPELTDPKSVLSKRSVFFDFDSYVVQSQYVSLVEAHAKFLKSHNDAKILIQGNTDERGSSEYNLALGQKRADAVKKNMVLLGVPESQIESVSLGKEKPQNLEHDESAWAENRRSDILYNGEF